MNKTKIKKNKNKKTLGYGSMVVDTKIQTEKNSLWKLKFFFQKFYGKYWNLTYTIITHIYVKHLRPNISYILPKLLIFTIQLNDILARPVKKWRPYKNSSKFYKLYW